MPSERKNTVNQHFLGSLRDCDEFSCTFVRDKSRENGFGEFLFSVFPVFEQMWSWNIALLQRFSLRIQNCFDFKLHREVYLLKNSVHNFGC